MSSSTIDHAKATASLLKRLRSGYTPTPPVKREPLEEFLFAFLLWESTTSKAEAATKRILASIVDFNELRVCRPPELAALLGKTYPRAEERALRLRASLQDMYLREYEVSLAPALAMHKREARKYIESINGMPQFVGARLLLTVFDAHAVPIDDRTLHKLIAAEVLEPGSDVAKAAGVLERHIKAEDALESHGLLQAWSEDSSADPTAKSRTEKPARRGAATARGSDGTSGRSKSGGKAKPAKA